MTALIVWSIIMYWAIGTILACVAFMDPVTTLRRGRVVSDLFWMLFTIVLISLIWPSKPKIS